MKAFPSLSSWIHAAKLYVAAFTGVMFFTVFFWFFLMMLPFAFDSGIEELPVIFMLIALTSLLTGFLLYQVVRFLYWALLKLFWKHPPRTITPQGFRASLHSYSILTVASLPATIVLMVYGILDTVEKPSTRYDMVRYNDPDTFFALLFSWVLLLTAAYLYEWFPLRQRQQQALKRAV